MSMSSLAFLALVVLIHAEEVIIPSGHEGFPAAAVLANWTISSAGSGSVATAAGAGVIGSGPIPVSAAANVEKKRGVVKRWAKDEHGHDIEEETVDPELALKEELHDWELEYGVDHPKVAHTLSRMAELYMSEPARSKEVEALLVRALAIREKGFGPDHRIVAESLSLLGQCYQSGGKLTQAKQLFERAIGVWDNAFGVRVHTHLGSALYQLAELHHGFGEKELAEQRFERAYRVWTECERDQKPMTQMAKLQFARLQHRYMKNTATTVTGAAGSGSGDVRAVPIQASA